jgi:hypothetical protein
MASSSAKEIRRFTAALQASMTDHVGRVPEDPVEFARKLGLDPDPWQERALLSDHPRVLLNCCRQSGKSRIAATIAAHRAITHKNSLVLIIAPSERQAKECFSTAARAYNLLGEAVPADSYRKLGVELRNGSRIEALPGTERTVRGFAAVDLLIVDEAARVADELYFAVRPMLAVSGGRLMMLSTPYGKRGAFYEAWHNGGEEEWERYEIPASQCPRISEDFLEEERRQMPEYVFAQEYCCEFRETDDQVFTWEMVYGAVDEEVEPLVFAEEAW